MKSRNWTKLSKYSYQRLRKRPHDSNFPKLVFSIKKGTNFSPQDQNYDIKQLALKCSTKRMYPDILNYDNLRNIR
ncbi:anaerobic ribonucleoside-triphosphate reductase [Staphylococcus aureus]